MSEYRRKRQGQFGQELRNLRGSMSLSGREAAELAGTDQSTISRVENGHIRPSHELLARLLDTYQASPAAKKRLAAELTELDIGVSSWKWLEEQQQLPRQTYIRNREREALKRRGFHMEVLPGLLQTPAYAAEVLRDSPPIAPEQVPEGVALRTERQKVLFEEGRTFGFVITEYALRRPFGTPDLMRTQYERLLHLASDPRISVTVIPMWARYPVTPSGFTIFDDSYVYIGTITKPLEIVEGTQVQDYVQLYATLEEAALTEEESLRMVKDLIERGRRTPEDDDRGDTAPGAATLRHGHRGGTGTAGP
ncbi:Scr1 family TA system antitoxin-like transcriptional regulator [Nocardiopsis sp. NPDC007018]|uniref:helix-turn-helix domain-containing protein n=1 Tax=Nocardiopsis sp. NPDC007018 TaxID=3155721 RepID=UPI0033BFEC48